MVQITEMRIKTHNFKSSVNVCSRNVVSHVADVYEAMLFGGIDELSSNVLLAYILSRDVDDGNICCWHVYTEEVHFRNSLVFKIP